MVGGRLVTKASARDQVGVWGFESEKTERFPRMWRRLLAAIPTPPLASKCYCWNDRTDIYMNKDEAGGDGLDGVGWGGVWVAYSLFEGITSVTQGYKHERALMHPVSASRSLPLLGVHPGPFCAP